jgi:hypothetical protein
MCGALVSTSGGTLAVGRDMFMIPSLGHDRLTVLAQIQMTPNILIPLAVGFGNQVTIDPFILQNHWVDVDSLEKLW